MRRNPVHTARGPLQHGASGYVNAQRHEHALQLAGVNFALRQELDGGWTPRLGPFPAAQARQAIDSFLGL